MFNALKTPSVHLLSSPSKHHNNVCLANIYESVINHVQFLYSNQISQILYSFKGVLQIRIEHIQQKYILRVFFVLHITLDMQRGNLHTTFLVFLLQISSKQPKTNLFNKDLNLKTSFNALLHQKHLIFQSHFLYQQFVYKKH